jgi:hypothetical protein
MKNYLFAFVCILIFSCSKNGSDAPIKEEVGTIMLSGGLAYCASQIHLDNGDTLIVQIGDIYPSFRSGDRVTVTYKEKGINKNCPPGIDCEVVGIR